MRHVSLAVCLVATAAAADQFVMTDVTYEHSAATTTDSHYRVPRPNNTPANWRSPIDYASSTVYTHIEVLTKPAGDAPSVWVICFEGTGYACYWSPVYRTGPTTLDFSFKFPDFFQYTAIDWTKPIYNTALILKDDMNVKVAPENVGAARAALYMPTRVRIVVTVVSPGGTYVPPLPGDAGVMLADAGPRDPGDAGSSADAGAGDAGPAQHPLDPPRDGGTLALDRQSQEPVAGGCSAVAASPLLMVSLLSMLRSRWRLFKKS
jgi:hypothetical protein